MRTIFVLLLITICSFLHAQFWTKVGETLGEIQDTTLELIRDSAEATSQWWDKEGEDRIGYYQSITFLLPCTEELL